MPDGPAEKSRLVKRADQIIAVNGVDMMNATHEQAATALKSAPAEVALILQQRPQGMCVLFFRIVFYVNSLVNNYRHFLPRRLVFARMCMKSVKFRTQAVFRNFSCRLCLKVCIANACFFCCGVFSRYTTFHSVIC